MFFNAPLHYALHTRTRFDKCYIPFPVGYITINTNKQIREGELAMQMITKPYLWFDWTSII